VALVTLTIVASEMEAEMLCGELRSNGIACMHQSTGAFADSYGSAVNSAVFGEAATTAVLVDETQLEDARKLLPANQ
jgi:Putative prokaryotic signal transducing protein